MHRPELGLRFAALLSLSIAALAPSACGDDSSGGPPESSGGSGGADASQDGEEPPIGEPGVCKQLCCSSADCPAGQSCTPFESVAGTLGACSGGTSDGGWPASGGAAGAAGAASGGSAGASSLPAGCWTLNEAECNPLGNSGCDPEDLCDYGPGDQEFEPIVACFGGPGERGAGQSCDGALGPFCAAGYHCAPK